MNQQKEMSDAAFAETISGIWALPLYLPLRLNVGKRILGGLTGVSFAFVFFFAGLTQSLPVMLWLLVFLISFAQHKLATAKLARMGYAPHSYYTGYPTMMRGFCKRFSESTVKTKCEPLVILLVGIACSWVDQAAFVFFTGGAMSMALSAYLTAWRQEVRLDSMRDATIEGEILQSGFKRRRW